LKKKTAAAFFFLCVALPAFSQRISSLGIFPFEVSGSGLNAGDAAELTRQVRGELASWGTIAVLNEDQAETADYQVRGQVARSNNTVVLTATTFETRTGRALNSSREQAATVSELSSRIFSFCAQVVEQVPFPNYLLGKWTSTVNMSDGPLTCVIEFLSGRVVRVERYDTYEHRRNNALTYQGYGSGTYSYSGQVRRTQRITGAGGSVRESPVDGTVSVSFSLEDTLPNYRALQTNRISVVFNDDKTSFELLSAGFPCGENFGGPSVYPQSTVVYTQFNKMP
jgi:hypothetical protein